MAGDQDVESFVRLVEALRPQLDSIVFAGGWAHRLHRLHPLAQPIQYAPLMTRDADIAVPLRGLAEDDLRAQLLAADFHEEFTGDHQPPVARYELGNAAGAFYAEFLTPLMGAEHKRDGTPEVTARIGGISALKLRYLDLLLYRPWTIRLEGGNGFPLNRPAAVHIPNAAAYLAQKILIHEKRNREKRARDLLYLHDTIETFGRSFEQLRGEWQDHVRPQLHPRAAAVVENSAAVLFSGVTDDIRNAAIQAGAAGRMLNPETVRRVGEAGLTAIFK